MKSSISNLVPVLNLLSFFSPPAQIAKQQIPHIYSLFNRRLANLLARWFKFNPAV